MDTTFFCVEDMFIVISSGDYEKLPSLRNPFCLVGFLRQLGENSFATYFWWIKNVILSEKYYTVWTESASIQ